MACAYIFLDNNLVVEFTDDEADENILDINKSTPLQ
jgi:hypothetical protein